MIINGALNLKITIKEEDRLSSVIAEIDEDVKIVPRSAFIKTPDGKINANRSFEGNLPHLSRIQYSYKYKENDYMYHSVNFLKEYTH